MDQQFECIVAVLVHLDEHLESTPAPLRSCEYLLARQLALLLSLIAIDFEVASGDAVLVECLVSESNCFSKSINLALVTIFEEEFVVEREKSNTRGLGHDPEHKI